MDARVGLTLQSVVARDHALLRDLIANMPHCQHAVQQGLGCGPMSCRNGDRCGFAIRQALHKLMFSSLAHFEHECQMMKANRVSHHLFEDHCEQHGVLSGLLNEASRKIAEADNWGAIAALAAFADAYDEHRLRFDSLIDSTS